MLGQRRGGWKVSPKCSTDPFITSQEINMKETKAGSTLYRIALRVDVKKYPV